MQVSLKLVTFVTLAVNYVPCFAQIDFVHVLNAHIFDPPAWWDSWRVVYHRAVELNDGTLLSSWENYQPEPPLEAAPIWRSTDGGRSYSNFSQVSDQVNGWGMRYQPFLYVLPSDFADLSAGDILFAGNSVPADLSATKIDVYASTDGGATWTFRSSVATGGRATAANGYTPIWEPYLLLHEGELICYYSDQRDPNHGQKLTHQTTTDLEQWSGNVDDVADPNYSARPGMFIPAQVGDGSWIAVYEVCGSNGCPVYFKVASSPLNFGDSTGHLLQASDGTTGNASPYITWVPNGGNRGTVIASVDSDSALWINRDLGAPGTPWTRVNVGAEAAHSRTLLPLSDGESLMIAGAGHFQAGPDPNNVVYSIVDLANVVN